MSGAPVNPQPLRDDERWICPGKDNKASCKAQLGWHEGDVSKCGDDCGVKKEDCVRCSHCGYTNIKGSQICVTSFLDSAPCTETDLDALAANEESSGDEGPAENDKDATVVPGPSESSASKSPFWLCINCAKNRPRDQKLQWNKSADKACRHCQIPRAYNSVESFLCHTRVHGQQIHLQKNPVSAKNCVDPACRRPLPNVNTVGGVPQTTRPPRNLDLLLEGAPDEADKWVCKSCGMSNPRGRATCEGTVDHRLTPCDKSRGDCIRVFDIL
jgi:hypothetical protein